MTCASRNFLPFAMRIHAIVRAFLFLVFFSIGAAALSCSILYNDLLHYYTNRQLLRAAEESLNRLESLNADYDALLQQLQKDPNLFKRIAPPMLGTERDDQDTVYPEVTREQLAAARRVLTEDLNQQQARPMVPDWIIRCSKPSRRIILFVAGGFLILISFIWFGSTWHGSREELQSPER